MMDGNSKQIVKVRKKENPVESGFSGILVLVGCCLIVVFMVYALVDDRYRRFWNDMVQIRPWGIVIERTHGRFFDFSEGCTNASLVHPIDVGFLGLSCSPSLVGMFVEGRNPPWENQNYAFSVPYRRRRFGLFRRRYRHGCLCLNAHGSIMDVPLVGTGFIDLWRSSDRECVYTLLPGYYLIYCCWSLLITVGHMFAKD